MNKINYYVFKEIGGDNTIDVIVEDGGVASSYNTGDYYKTDYYQNRITNETTRENLWGELSEGKMFNDGGKWENINPTENELIDDMVNWLCFGALISKVPTEFIKHDMGEMTDEKFLLLKSKLNLDENI